MTSIPQSFAQSLSDRYRIERPLGAGGMATVYLAADLKHGREVALKVLRPELAEVVGAERFLQEVKTTASLRHPNILPLFDSGEAAGRLFYVMPYIEGETLRQRLDREGQLGVEEAVRLVCDVAEAVDHAHRQGVVHRDIKPENILLQDGRPLVADFGVALALTSAAGSRLTETGLAVGTPRYMSPEQVTGERAVTHRSDVHALGAVLYEALAGSPPHTGSTAQAVITRILVEVPTPLTELRKTVPPHVAAATAKALEKLPADRFDSAADFAAALRGERVVAPAVAATTGHAPHAEEAVRPARVPWRVVAPALAAVGLTGALAGAALRGAPETASEGRVVRFSIPVPEGHEIRSGWPEIDVSPDGSTVVYTADNTLFKRRVDAEEPQALLTQPGICCPKFSPDGAWIFLGAGGPRPGASGVSVDGGPLVDLSNQASGYDIVTATATDSGIRRMRPGATAWERLTAVDTLAEEGAHMWPQLLPGGRKVLFTALGPSLMWDGASIVVQDLESGERRTVVQGGTYGRYLPTGHVAYVDAAGTLHAVPFDVERGTVTGSPIVVEAGVRTAYWAGGASVAISENGTLVYVKGSSLRNHRLTWVDRSGRTLGTVGAPYTVEGIRVSPTGRWAVSYVASANSDVGLFDLGTGEMRSLTLERANEDNPVWSADGARVAYHVGRSGRVHDLAVQEVPATGDPRVVHTSTSYLAPRSWSPDGRYILAWDAGALVTVDLQTATEDTITARTGVEGGRISPDGRWLAYSSLESGRSEVHLAEFPALSGTYRLSAAGGRMPEWAPSTGELFYLAGDTLMSVQVPAGGDPRRASPRPLFVSPELGAVTLWYGVSPDGGRFLYPAPNPDAPAREIHVVVDWFEELRGR